MNERKTGVEPATNSLEGCDSTTELLPRGWCPQQDLNLHDPVTVPRFRKPGRYEGINFAFSIEGIR